MRFGDWRPELTSHRLSPVLALALFFSTTASGEIKRGQFSFGSERSCIAGSSLGAELCANAAVNAQTAFDEMAPRFPTRGACEQTFGRAGCSLGFSGADGWAGKRSGIYFTPRQSGFRITVSSERQMVVVPFVAGASLGFSPRTILEKDTRIDSRKARAAREAGRDRLLSGGVEHAADVKPAPLPVDRRAPRMVDPNFDCAAVLEAGADATTGCYPAPARR